ncbi:unnamed protein product [Euphydryas editha]|uniref:Histone-lysine N-methyltransferase SETMAR n=1 Tax=Euphydryas editha TaxID=104508 RepID=A0AAU9UT54_EUPED|nr:unnamed protein product [Euphydryas editha]
MECDKYEIRCPSAWNIERLEGKKYKTNPVPTFADYSTPLDKDTIHCHLKSLGKIYKSCRIVPHELTKIQPKRRVEMVELSMTRYIVGQLMRMYEVISEKYPGLVNGKRVLLQQDNAKPHTAKVTRYKIEELGGVELLPHPEFSTDLAPSDYYLFRSMAKFLRGEKFESKGDVKNAVRQFFASKPKEWFYQGIKELAERWVKTIEYDGLYILRILILSFCMII